jgi:hypothetical protein
MKISSTMATQRKHTTTLFFSKIIFHFSIDPHVSNYAVTRGITPQERAELNKGDFGL